MIRRSRLPLGISCIAVVCGCATERRDANFAQVQAQVAERTGSRVLWVRDTGEDREAAQAVQALLQEELTVAAAVQIALLNNPQLQALYEELGVAQADLVAAGLLRNPMLLGELRFPGRPRLPFEIDVAMEFVQIFLLPLRRRVAESAFEAARLRVTHNVLDLAADVRSAFFRVQAAKQILELRQTIALATAASVEAAERLREAGNITELDLAREVGRHQHARVDVARAEAQVLDKREALNVLMGVWGMDTQWTIGRRLPELPPEDPELRGLESLAVAQRLDLAEARQHIVTLAERLQIERSTALLPDLTVTGHVEGEPDGMVTAGPSVEFPVPIFDQGQADIARAQAQFRQSRRRHAALAVSIRSEVRRAGNRMAAARERASYYRTSVLPLRQRIVDQAQLQYNAMQLGIFELLRAREEQVTAVRDYTEALRDYWLARTELERAVGGRLPVPEPVLRPVPEEELALPLDEPPPPPHEHHDHERRNHQDHDQGG